MVKMKNFHAQVGPPELWDIKRKFQHDFCLEMGLKKKHRFLDIGCGVLRGGIPIISHLYSGRYIGVDVREETIKIAHEELMAHKLVYKKPELLVCEDIGDLPVEGPIDFVWAFSVLFHMHDEILVKCMSTVKRILAADGVFYANVDTSSKLDGSWKGFPKVHRSLETMTALAEDAGFSASSVGALKDLGHVTGKAGQDNQVMLRFEHG
jgi:SAM-dependent methyltransferase